MLSTFTTILHAPSNTHIQAQIVELTADLADNGIHRDWWEEQCLLPNFDPPPIDRHWNWNQIGIESEGRLIASERVALVTGDGPVQGAMMISVEPALSVLTPGIGVLFVELLFTAPRNRPNLRRDGKPYLLGVGTKLLTWGVWLSRQRGCDGRLRLDGSPEHIGWHLNRGLQKLDMEPNVFEGVSYLPMELPEASAELLLSEW